MTRHSDVEERAGVQVHVISADAREEHAVQRLQLE
jgi:hypothetical protein